MFERQRTGSVLCPGCGLLVGVNDDACFHCGRRKPGPFGFARSLRDFANQLQLSSLVIGVCGIVYLASLVVDPRAIGGGGGLLSVGMPTMETLLRLGAAGSIPLYDAGRWWTPLSAGWLHGGLLHIAFNMMAARDLVPIMSHFYGTARTVIIYTIASVAGFLASSTAGHLTLLPSFLKGAPVTIGASAAIFGLIGALLHYGHRSGSRVVRDAATRWAVSGLIFGFVMTGVVDNWAHLGGLGAGYAASFVLDPLKPERGDHAVLAVVCLVASAAALVASVLVPLPLWIQLLLH